MQQILATLQKVLRGFGELIAAANGVARALIALAHPSSESLGRTPPL